MAKLSLRTLRSAILSPAILLLMLLALWLWIRWGYLPGAQPWRSVAANVFLGWLAVLFLVTTVSSIIWGASDDRPKAFLKWAILVDGSGLLLLWTGCGSGLISFWDALRLYALLLAWGICWLEFTHLSRRLSGAAPAIALALALAMFLFAGPVTLVPLVRAAATWRAGMQDTLVSAIGITTPMLAALDAMKASLRIDWPQLPLMYHLSILGQDIPMALPTWWINALTCASAAAICWLAAIFLSCKSTLQESQTTANRP